MENCVNTSHKNAPIQSKFSGLKENRKPMPPRFFKQHRKQKLTKHKFARADQKMRSDQIIFRITQFEAII